MSSSINSTSSSTSSMTSPSSSSCFTFNEKTISPTHMEKCVPIVASVGTPTVQKKFIVGQVTSCSSSPVIKDEQPLLKRACSDFEIPYFDFPLYDSHGKLLRAQTLSAIQKIVANSHLSSKETSPDQSNVERDVFDDINTILI